MIITSSKSRPEKCDSAPPMAVKGWDPCSGNQWAAKQSHSGDRLKIGGYFTTTSRPYRTPDTQVNVLAHEPHRSITQLQMDAPGMPTAGWYTRAPCGEES
jgi:hypothetical protein